MVGLFHSGNPPRNKHKGCLKRLRKNVVSLAVNCIHLYETCRKRNLTADSFARAEALNRYHVGDTPNRRIEKCTCNVCGRKFTAYGKAFYCSAACHQKSISIRATCPVCGARLIDKGVTTGKGCCSDECRQKHRIQTAIQNGRYISCAYCGKKFIRHSMTNKFCSQECYRAALQASKK